MFHRARNITDREYFFGGGIQSEDPNQFRRNTGLHPFQVLTLGHTNVKQSEFDNWCQDRMLRGIYSADAYDLIERNCNNFCYDATTQCLGLASTEFPTWILDVPRRFMASPMGQMVRPMLRNMQISSAVGAVPVTTAAATAPTLPLVPPNNPWANMSLERSEESWMNKDIVVSKPPPDCASLGSKTPLLDSLTKPLLSIDTKTVDLCIQKLSANNNDETATRVLESAAPILRGLDIKKLQQQQQEEEMWDAEPMYQILLKTVESNETLRTFALMLLRLVVLHPSNITTKEATQQDKTITGTTTTHDACMNWLQTHLRNNDGTGPNFSQFSSPVARSMAWLIASNAIGAAAGKVERLDDWIDVAIVELSSASGQRNEVRQAALALLYNAVLTLRNDDNNFDLPDTAVSMLIAALEGLTEERDSTTKLRRLMVIGRILKPVNDNGGCSVNPTAKNLVVDLGFKDALWNISSGSRAVEAEKCQTLASELLRILAN